MSYPYEITSTQQNDGSFTVLDTAWTFDAAIDCAKRIANVQDRRVYVFAPNPVAHLCAIVTYEKGYFHSGPSVRFIDSH